MLSVTVAENKTTVIYATATDPARVAVAAAHAHLDFSGNDWDCDRPYRRQGGECSLPREGG